MTFLRHVTPALALALAACGSQPPGAGGPGGPGGNAAPAVSVLAVREEPLSITAEFPGRTAAARRLTSGHRSMA
jgi:membrane fusion protein (multidrug efflux system)